MLAPVGVADETPVPQYDPLTAERQPQVRGSARHGVGRQAHAVTQLQPVESDHVRVGNGGVGDESIDRIVEMLWPQMLHGIQFGQDRETLKFAGLIAEPGAKRGGDGALGFVRLVHIFEPQSQIDDRGAAGDGFGQGSRRASVSPRDHGENRDGYA